MLSRRGPSSAARAATAGARSAVSQPRSVSWRRASIRAEVIIPRFPTIIRSVRAKVSRTIATAAMNAAGSAVLPPKDPDRDRAPGRVGEQPAGVCGRPYFPAREWP